VGNESGFLGGYVAVLGMGLGRLGSILSLRWTNVRSEIYSGMADQSGVRDEAAPADSD